MNTYHSFLFMVLVLLCSAVRASDDADVKRVAKAKVEEMHNALIKGDFATVADLTHPKLVKREGGRDKMIALLYPARNYGSFSAVNQCRKSAGWPVTAIRSGSRHA